ncbi:hypothetical protein CAC42_7202 [Sphaceloma murrayae]|uniref:Uncharacterized protein n=1 Tax=Sphaceloma murrayae TaxID=2082308 RepID=A0A2K1QPW0_9PEZI|nr:hypothetical protein CAC42_7202 [Sphaceloma murrayae]
MIRGLPSNVGRDKCQIFGLFCETKNDQRTTTSTAHYATNVTNTALSAPSDPTPLIKLLTGTNTSTCSLHHHIGPCRKEEAETQNGSTDKYASLQSKSTILSRLRVFELHTNCPALIRYFLQHPLTPRPLRFSRNRYLRHWTIHRAWQVFRAKTRQLRELELERQYNSMREACEALRLMDGKGMRVEEGSVEASSAKDVGRLYRIAMLKNDVWGGVPIEYARIQTQTPARDGWNHEWKR